MLESSQKKQIQEAYSAFLKSRDLSPRSGQKLMIAEIARALASVEVDAEGERSSPPSVTVVEAGTGTGKTIGYVLPAVIMAQSSQKRLVISTATVTLQEQIVGKDLPDIIQGSGLTFSFALAKGRGRYACLSKLDRQLQDEQQRISMIDMFAGEVAADSHASSAKLYQSMLESFAQAKWDGDRDSWPQSIEDDQWRGVATDHAQCSGRRCGYFRQCPFFRAREGLDRVNVIVTNHDLVLADLALGGGTVLPDPGDTIYVFDEGHHLPDKAIGHFTYHGRIRSTLRWLERARDSLQGGGQSALPERLLANTEKLVPELSELIALLGEMREQLMACASFKVGTHRDDSTAIHRFADGKVSDAIRSQAALLKTVFTRCHRLVEKCVELLGRAMDGEGGELEPWQAEQIYPEFGALLMRLESQCRLWESFSQVDPQGAPPTARWLKWSEESFGEELAAFSSPILASNTLFDSLWNKGFASIVTSATLAALGSFERFRMRSGIPDDSRCVVVASPFRHAEVARLVVPDMVSDPRESQQHTDELIELLPTLLAEKRGTLVLFSSRKQMRDVFFGLESESRRQVLLQDDYSRKALLKEHKKKIESGAASVLFGLASLAEGIDLPGALCEHVIIAKIPFAVPNDPVESALAEWLEAQGRNPFFEITVPDAAIRLVQASGRLLRTEQDSGLVTLLDRRIVSRRYGRMILDSLPPFRRSIKYSIL